MVRLRTSFVQSNRPIIQNKSVQGVDHCLAFRRVRHFNEGQTARPVGIAVLYDRDGFNGPISPEEIPQLCLGGRRIEVSNEDVNHNFVLKFRS